VPEKAEGLADMWALFTQRNMLILYPLMMWCAISQATYMASFVPFMTLGMPTTGPNGWDDDKQIKESTLALVGFGIGQVVGGLVNGQLVDLLPTRTVALICIGELLVGAALLVYYTYQLTFTLWFAGVMNIAWGIQDSGANTFCYCILASQFDSKNLPLGLFFFTLSFFAFVFCYVEALITTHTAYLVYFSGCCVWALSSWILFFVAFKLRGKEEEEEIFEEIEEALVPMD